MELSLEQKNIYGTIHLDGSKSISNRILAIQMISGDTFQVNNISTSKDTVTFQNIIKTLEVGNILDCGHAGTTYRFLTAILAFRKGQYTLTGSDRMKERPIGVLVDALRSLGANISYLEKEGYPPLLIDEANDNIGQEISIDANISSQYISALLLLAPSFPKGISISLTGNIVSKSYIKMTLNIMHQFGIEYTWDENTIHIKNQKYQTKTYDVEADWSAASYYFAMAAIADSADLELVGLQKNSTQGDSAMVEIMSKLDIHTTYTDQGILIKKDAKAVIPEVLEWDFNNCPDIAQTVIITCGALGIIGMFTGLITLKIKETDRIQALKTELEKVGVYFIELPAKLSKTSNRKNYIIEGKAVLNNPIFDTYQDHRMAMSFAPLALLGKITINNPEVVGKSYPEFWNDIEKLS